MKTKNRMLFRILMLLMASFACGTIQVGILSPTPEEDSVLIAETQEPEFQITAPMKVNIQSTVEPSSKPVIEEPPTFPTQRDSVSATAWLGHVVALPEGGMYDDFMLLSPAGGGEFGVAGATPELESEIRFLRDAEGSDEYVYFWGQYSCGVADYGQCQLLVDHIQRAGYTENYVQDWVGTISTQLFNNEVHTVFQLVGDIPMWYGIRSTDSEMQTRIEALSDSGAIVQLSGTVMIGVPDVNGLRIDPYSIDVVEAGSGEGIGQPGEGLAQGWQIYSNDRFGYRLQHPEKAEIVEHGPDGGVPTNEIPEGMTADLYQEQLQKVYPKLCVEIKYGQGYVNISAPINAGARYSPCWRTGVGVAEILPISTEVDVGGQLYTVDGMEIISDYEHSENFSLELDDGTQIRFGGGSKDGGSYEDYLTNNRDILLQILASYQPFVKQVYRTDASQPGSLPGTAACEPGYFGNLEEAISVLIYDINVRDYAGLKAMMGEPFTIAYWRSEGVSLPREEAIRTLSGGIFPPGKIPYPWDESQLPDVDEMFLYSLWPPEVDIAAQIYSPNWGGEENGAAILTLARCSDGRYYWYGILYAGDGFE
jgi:hypothetical protein